MQTRHDYTRDELIALFALPLPRLLRHAQQVHAEHFPDDEIQLCTLMSVKTGGCPEDCGYCPQSARYQTGLTPDKQLDVDAIVRSARAAKEGGSTRFCMGAAWRSVPTRGEDFPRLLRAVREVNALGLEVCTTLGMVTPEQAAALKEAGVYAYNHNLDTSPEYYGSVISTRTYEDRLATLRHVRAAGMSVCCGGIVGMGEGRGDRAGLIEQLNHLDPHPESVPVNLLVRVEGTPLAQAADLDTFELVRTIAVTRIALPRSRVRLSAGRAQMSDEAQALCFLAGANSIFTGEKLLTTPNPGATRDAQLLSRLGMRPAPAERAP